MHRKRQQGQAMVEFALVLPILILLLCGIIDFGWIFGNQIIVNNATREAARYTAIHYNNSDFDMAIAKSIVQDRAPTLPDPTVIINQADGKITVFVESDIDLLTPFTSIFLGETYTAKATSVMRIE